MVINRLRYRIAAIFVSLLLVVQVIGFGVLSLANSRAAEESLVAQLDTGHRVLQQSLTGSPGQLERAAIGLAGDAQLRDAIAARDLAALRRLLAQHDAQGVADAMLLLDPAGRVVAHSMSDDLAASSPGWPALARRSVREHAAGDFALLGDGALYQLVALPIRAPQAVGHVVLGVRVGDAFAASVHRTIAQHLSVVRVSAGGRVHLLGSSLAGAARDEIERLALDWDHADAPGNRQLRLGEVDFATRLVPLGANQDQRAFALLQRSVDEAFAPFERQALTLAVVTAAGILIFGLGSLVMARRLSEPVNRLVAAAQRIEDGEYADPGPIEAGDEIAALVNSFNHMRRAIERREEHIARLAFHDPLTGLPNRIRLIKRFGETIAAAATEHAEVAVLLVNLDRFKTVNLSLGHAAGDEVLREVAHRLGTIARQHDTLGHVGGDEFAIVMSRCGVEQAPALAERVYAALAAEPCHVQGLPVDVHASIGIAAYPRHGDDPATLLRCAELALYEAKRTRFGHAVYDPSIEANAQGHLQTLGQLRRAVQNGELELHYQPQVTLGRPARVTGAEALLRWRHPERGMVPPGDFIPFAESTGFVRVLTAWVLQHAVRQLRDWHGRGLMLELAVNISAHDLARPDFAELVSTLLAQHGVPPAALTLELTESGFMRNPAVSLQTLAALHRVGVRLAVDDYGTGHASLAYLQKMPIQLLKIDRSFVMDMNRRLEDATIVRSTVELAHGLGLQVVAEGVESPEHERLLAKMGCDGAQGFGIARPMTPEALETWMLDRRLAAIASGERGIPARLPAAAYCTPSVPSRLQPAADPRPADIAPAQA